MNINDLFDLIGKEVAMVTGAGSGPGVEFAVAFAQAGADIVCVDVDFAAAKQTVEMTPATHPSLRTSVHDPGPAD
ncbi:hypothetical protein Mycsm_06647 (plasmid) [Mycobacterium sp. JS623]|jgi:NAD(P)-dependent dehydrogenase (short-subunit alcohol dehydrogenase family)|uniref:hypothetical protein n=1 Tax=Mycobacterium sp. JS623 TaxID=212767 RepID=UPI0002A57B14|nr:hypothetical protein [Mycobacterium sp. JS623]AGB26774.1 hypothetical protein Mycsm_06647 [Mycobacterium sp. JS623]